jgi:hypothetical protein
MKNKNGRELKVFVAAGVSQLGLFTGSLSELPLVATR